MRFKATLSGLYLAGFLSLLTGCPAPIAPGDEARPAASVLKPGRYAGALPCRASVSGSGGYTGVPAFAQESAAAIRVHVDADGNVALNDVAITAGSVVEFPTGPVLVRYTLQEPQRSETEIVLRFTTAISLTIGASNFSLSGNGAWTLEGDLSGALRFREETTSTFTDSRGTLSIRTSCEALLAEQ